MLRILWAGKTRDAVLAELATRYLERIRRCAPLRLEEVAAGRGGRRGQAAGSEAERLLGRIPPAAVVVTMDAGGRQMSSEGFAAWLGRLLAGGTGDLAFVLGGHEGLAPALTRRANHSLSLSKMTFTHEMARVLFLEQLYRAFTILRGEPYHQVSAG
jgi:23S rRNA (pseudouridine1915-N3)-methyltransferase